MQSYVHVHWNLREGSIEYSTSINFIHKEDHFSVGGEEENLLHLEVLKFHTGLPWWRSG